MELMAISFKQNTKHEAKPQHLVSPQNDRANKQEVKTLYQIIQCKTFTAEK